MKYLFISYDAIKELASIRQFQSSEFNESKELCQVLNGKVDNWSKFKVNFKKTTNGGVLTTAIGNFNKGVVFDLSTFNGFQNAKNNQVVTIFQKVIKFSIRFFEKLPPTSCERHLPNSLKSIVYPFPFSATKDVYRVLIDRDANTKKYSKRGKSFLLVYADCSMGNYSEEVSYTNLKKAIEESDNIRQSSDLFHPKVEEKNEPIEALQLTELESIKDLSITSSIGHDNWNYYLTANQKIFIEREVSGPERLEGAAGTGKTLTLILRCINTLKKQDASGSEMHLLFITHSISTKKNITDIFKSNFDQFEKFLNKSHSSVSITITTLQEWCINFLGSNIGSTEYLDRDAQDSKGLQLMYIEESFDKVMQEDFESYKLFCSPKFIHFFDKTSKKDILEMLQFEIGVIIKGRANEDIEKYKNLPRIVNSIPCEKEGDLNFLFLIYKSYQDMLRKTNQFDSDDIVLTALGQLNTPIWRRRREREGFTACFVDETHLFNFNELSVIHFLNKESQKDNIIFAIDKSQAVGDRGLVDQDLFDLLGFNQLQSESSFKLNTVFRSSPDIINLAFNVLSSGATLFTNFENPINKVQFNFTEEEEKKSSYPKYILKSNDDEIIETSFEEAERLRKNLNTQNSRILIVATTGLLLNNLEQHAKKRNKPFESLKSRGDQETVKAAVKRNRFLLAGIDYVGGLEFDAVIVIGVDKGRVPPNGTGESYHFLNHAWHNRMYVAITRAKYSIVLIGDKTRGESKLFKSSIENEILKVE